MTFVQPTKHLRWIAASALWAIAVAACAGREAGASPTVPTPEGWASGPSSAEEAPALLPSPTASRPTLAPTPTAEQLPAATPLPASGPDRIAVETVDKLAELRVLNASPSALKEVTFSPDSSLVAAASADGKVYMWRASDGSLVRVLEGHTDDVNGLAFSPDGSYLASGSDDRTVRIWRVADGGVEKIIEQSFVGRVLEVAFSPDGKFLALSGNFCYAELRHTSSWILWRTLVQPKCATREGGGAIYFALAFSPDSSLIATGEGRSCCGGSIQLWQVDDYMPPRLMRGYDLVVRDVAYSPDGSTLAAALVGSPYFWLMDIDKPFPPRVLQGHVYRVNKLAFSPDGTLLASSSRDSTVRLWHPDTAKEIGKLEGHLGGISSVAFSPDGTLLATSGNDGTVGLWGVVPVP